MQPRFSHYVSHLKSDLAAGLVVFLVALPLCLGVALASGAPLFSGIIAGIVGGVVVGIISGSAVGVSGPAAGLTVTVLTSIDKLGSYQAFLLAVIVAGLIQIALAALRAGILVYFFPSSVIKGMLAAIGLILILKQIPHALGFDADQMGDESFLQSDGNNTFTEIAYALERYSPGAIVISALSLALLILFDRPFMKRFVLFQFLPSALFVVVAGVGINELYKLFYPDWVLSKDHLVTLPVTDSPDDLWALFMQPDWSAFRNFEVYTTAGTIAVVATLETLLSVDATDKLDPYKRKTPADREILAQGVGNIASGLLGGIPITQVIVRSSANINAGGRTRVATVVHGLLLLASAVLIPHLLNLIPLASLSAILLLLGYKLIKPSMMVQIFRMGWEQFIPFAVTVVAIVFSDLLQGIGVGMIVSIFYILRANMRNAYSYNRTEMGKRDGIYITLSQGVTFLNKGSIITMLEKLESGDHVIIDGVQTKYINHDVLEILHDFKENIAPQRGIHFELRNLPALPVTLEI
ncbi:SulP family inorganic anion transporter [Rhodoflexus sp.]